MVSSLLTRMPMPVKIGVPVAAALLAAACSSSSSSSAASSAPSAGSTGSGSAAAASGTVIKTTAGSTGAFLTDSSGHALYLFAKDGKNMSSCTGACASAWPPVMAKGSVTGSGSVKASDLGTIALSNGSKQVTYDGHPLYTYAGDSGAGQTNGQGSDNFGAKWWLVAPTGAQITSADKASSSSGSGGGAPAAPAAPASPAGGGNAGGGWS